VRPRRRRRGAQQREHRLVVLLDRDGVGGAAAEPRDGLGDAQRVRGPERLAQAGASPSTKAGTTSARARSRSMPPAWSSNASGPSSSSVTGSSPGAG
jgi:hypothetical protein